MAIARASDPKARADATGENTSYQRFRKQAQDVVLLDYFRVRMRVKLFVFNVYDFYGLMVNGSPGVSICVPKGSV